MLSGSYQMLFEGCFENNAEEQMVSRIYGDGGHRCWLQGPLNLGNKGLTMLLQYYYVFWSF